jgi:hypothetical protein
MTDPNEISTLQASFRGALSTADSLAALKDRIESMEPGADVSESDLEELARVTAAHAIASAALRGFVTTMRARRGVGAPAALNAISPARPA